MRVFPIVVFVVLVTHLGHQFVAFLRSARAELVGHRRDVSGFDLLEHGREYLPRLEELVAAHEGGLLAPEHLEHQPRVGIRAVEANKLVGWGRAEIHA